MRVLFLFQSFTWTAAHIFFFQLSNRWWTPESTLLLCFWTTFFAGIFCSFFFVLGFSLLLSSSLHLSLSFSSPIAERDCCDSRRAALQIPQNYLFDCLPIALFNSCQPRILQGLDGAETLAHGQTLMKPRHSRALENSEALSHPNSPDRRDFKSPRVTFQGLLSDMIHGVWWKYLRCLCNSACRHCYLRSPLQDERAWWVIQFPAPGTVRRPALTEALRNLQHLTNTLSVSSTAPPPTIPQLRAHFCSMVKIKMKANTVNGSEMCFCSMVKMKWKLMLSMVHKCVVLWNNVIWSGHQLFRCDRRGQSQCIL